MVRLDAEPACEDLLQNNIENVEDLEFEPRSCTFPTNTFATEPTHARLIYNNE